VGNQQQEGATTIAHWFADEIWMIYDRSEDACLSHNRGRQGSTAKQGCQKGWWLTSQAQLNGKADHRGSQ